MFPFLTIPVGPMLRQVLNEQGITQKEAADVMRYDRGKFSMAMNGGPLDLRKAILLPWPVFSAWWSKVVAAKAIEFGDELRAERSPMLKAELVTRADERKAAV